MSKKEDNMMLYDILQYHVENKMLICIERQHLGKEPLWGFPIFFNDKILIMTKIVDFRNEGIVIIRLNDITDAYSKKSDSFYEKICINEGLQNEIENWAYLKKAKDIQSSIECIMCNSQFISIQCEKNTNEFYFSIGKPIEINTEYIFFSNFDKQGIWENKLRKIPIKDITLILAGDYYAKMFYKYMDINSKNN